MIPVLYKKRTYLKGHVYSIMTSRPRCVLAEKPREWKEYVTYEHGAERWYA